MRRVKWFLLGMVLAGTATWAARETGPEAAKEEEGVIDPKADAALKAMSEYLSGLKSFRVDAVTVDEKVTTEGHKVQELKSQKVTVMRPGKLRVDRRGPNGKATLASDGAQVVLVNHDQNVYAKDKAPQTLTELVDQLRDRLHVDAPGGDFIIDAPYDEMIDGLQKGHYIGLEPVGEDMAHHLFVSEKDLDWQIWIRDGEQPVPLRYVITSKDMKSQPQFTIELRNWEPGAAIADDAFTVTVPANAKRIERRVQSRRAP